MDHGDRFDYNRFQDPLGLIPEGEPVFLIRASDAVSAEAVRAWAHLHLAAGGDGAIAAAAVDQAGRMADWQRIHGSKLADLPTNDVSAAGARFIPMEDLDGDMALGHLTDAAFYDALERQRYGNPKGPHDFLPSHQYATVDTEGVQFVVRENPEPRSFPVTLAIPRAALEGPDA